MYEISRGDFKSLIKDLEDSVNALEVLKRGITSTVLFLQKCIRPKKPPSVAVLVTGEDLMRDILVYTIKLPVLATPTDVVQREITVLPNGGSKRVITVTPETTEIQDQVGDQGETGVISLVDIDDSNNRSEPAEINYQLSDTIASPKPGTFSITVVAEKLEEPTPEPTPEPAMGAELQTRCV